MDFDESREKIKRIQIIDNKQILIGNEGHTLLNALRYSIDKSCDDVEFNGYAISHPSEPIANFTVLFKEQSQQNTEGVLNAINAGCDGLISICGVLDDELERAVELYHKFERK